MTLQPNIVLVGFMGTGKSTVGRRLAERLGRPFVDTDELIVARAGLPIPQIFAARGEEAFRALEAEVVAEVAERPGQVIATGGGVLLRPENVRRLRERGRLVLLTAAPEAILERLGRNGLSERPLLYGAYSPAERLERIRGLLRAREEAYAQADASVDTTGLTPDQVADLVLEQVNALERRPQEVPVRLGERSYRIHVEAGGLDRLGQLTAAALGRGPGAAPLPVLVVTNPEVNRLYGARAVGSLEAAGFAPHVAEVPAGEEHKNLAEAARLYDRCVEARLDRGSPVIALGGGVIGDLAGFVAATYLRGLPFVQVPTTLLAQVDASVGGKVAVNHERAKNLIGAFHQPRLVVADVTTLATLSPREFSAGMAEVIKHGVIADAEYFRFLEAEREAVARQEEGALIRVVAGSCRIKAAVVEADERESRLRMILNCGHTVGHALEAATGYRRFLHGEVVAIGLVAAGRLAQALGLGWSEAEQRRLEALLSFFRLPVRIPGLALGDLLAIMALDKKSFDGRINWVLPTTVGHVEIVSGVDAALVAGVLRELGAAAH